MAVGGFAKLCIVPEIKASFTRIRFCLKTEIFSLQFGVPSHTVKNGHRKRIFWKTLSRVEIFENAILLHSRVWMGENGGFWKQLRLDVGNQLLRMLPSKMVLFTTVIIYCFICGRAETIKKTQRVNANYWKQRKTNTCEQGQNLGYDSELLVDSFATYAYYRCIGP